MRSPVRYAVLLALAVAIGVAAFAVGRTTRDDDPAATSRATRLEQSRVDVSIPPLASVRPVPGLRQPPAEAAAPTAGAAPAASAQATPAPSGSAPSGGGSGGGGSGTPVVVGGGTE